MKSLLVFTFLPFLVYCQPRDYFFVPTMKAYNRMLCKSGIPGTENPLICPQNGAPLEYTHPVYRSPNRHSSPRSPLMSAEDTPIVRQQRRAPDRPYLVPLYPLMSSKREGPAPLQHEGKPKKIYLIPWESKGENPLVNYILVPDELLSPEAPLDTLDDERRFDLKITKERHEKLPRKPKSIERHIHHFQGKRKKRPKSSKFHHIHEQHTKGFRTVEDGQDGHDYDDDCLNE